jgi:hypothetical protein
MVVKCGMALKHHLNDFINDSPPTLGCSINYGAHIPLGKYLMELKQLAVF